MYHAKDSAMVPLVRVEEGDVNARLREIGAPKSALMIAVRGAAAGYDSCTDNDPPGARGYETWRCGSRDLRVGLLPLGCWDRHNTGLASVVNVGTGVRIVLLNTDGATGNPAPDVKPSNRLEKGVLHERAIEGDSGWLRGLEPEAEDGPKIWYLCVNITGATVTAELSRPSAMVAGYIIDWEERIILVQPGDWDPLDFEDHDRDEGPDFDIDVQRKK